METHSHGVFLQMIFLFKRVKTSGSSHKFSGGVSYILHMEHTWIFQVCVKICVLFIPKQKTHQKGRCFSHIWKIQVCIPSRELTYPTLRKGKLSTKIPFFGDMLVPWRVYLEPKCNPLFWLGSKVMVVLGPGLAPRLAEVEGSSLLDQCIRPRGVTLPMGIIVGGRNFGERNNHLGFFFVKS